MTNLGFQAAFVAVLALGQLLVIITRGIDLSVGSVVGLAGVLAVGVHGRRLDAARVRAHRPRGRPRQRRDPRLGPGDEPVHRDARDARHRARARAGDLRRADADRPRPRRHDARLGFRGRHPRSGADRRGAVARARRDARADAVGPVDLRRRRQPRRRPPRRDPRRPGHPLRLRAVRADGRDRRHPRRRPDRLGVSAGRSAARARLDHRRDHRRRELPRRSRPRAQRARRGADHRRDQERARPA